jgi:hypothetical protein
MFELVSPSIEKTFYIQASAQEDMNSWIEAIERGKNFYKPSAPFGLQHHVHVDFSSETGFSVRIPFVVYFAPSELFRAGYVANGI